MRPSSTIHSEDEFQEASKWKKGKTSLILLTDLFTENDLFTDEPPSSPIEEKQAVFGDQEDQGDQENQEKMAATLEDLANSYEHLICATQLQAGFTNYVLFLEFCNA